MGRADCEEGDESALALLDISSIAAQDMDSTVYRRVMGRWRRESVRALGDKLFWAQLVVAPFLHLVNRNLTCFLV